MKTPILISSIAALCLMINMNESGSRTTAKTNVHSDVIISEVAPGKACVASDKYVNLSEKEVTMVAPAAIIPDNFHYLKFNQNNFPGNIGTSAFEDPGVPGVDYSYLRFDVEDYFDPIADSPENIELPADDYSYLKFDVNEYVSSSELENTSDSEQLFEEIQL